MNWNDLRPEVQRFAVLMEQVLRANDHKSGWQYDYPSSLLKRLREEVDELEQAIPPEAEWSSPWGTRDVRALVRKEAADVANFALMIADVAGLTEEPDAS